MSLCQANIIIDVCSILTVNNGHTLVTQDQKEENFQLNLGKVLDHLRKTIKPFYPKHHFEETSFN